MEKSIGRYCLTHARAPGGRKGSRFDEARNVRAGGANPLHSLNVCLV
jgi:hypothetical protein